MDSFWEDYGNPTYDGIPLDLSVDEAMVQIRSDVDGLTLFKRSSLCVNCPYVKDSSVLSFSNASLKVTSKAYWSFLFSPNDQEYIWNGSNQTAVCSVNDVEVGQFGLYKLQLEDSSCTFTTMKEPVFPYGALIIAACVYFLIFLGTKLFNFLYKEKPYLFCMPCCPCLSTEIAETEPQPSIEPRKPRLKSLDVFRGITIILMIFVNHGGGGYWFFQHAVWNGLYVADIIFPWFMWIMGVCIPMGLRSQVKNGNTYGSIFFKILKRSVKLFIIGIVLNSIGGWNQLENYRIPGVLQRFALAYLFTSTVYMFFAKSIHEKSQELNKPWLNYMILLGPQWIIYTVITILYLLILFLVPVPGCPTGYLGAGGISNIVDGKPTPHCIGGVTRHVDIVLLGNSHLYQNPTAKSVYQAGSFDPEGILGTVPTLLQVFLGIVAGQILLLHRGRRELLSNWTICGVATGVLGLILCFGDFYSGPIPVNKNLWSLSFVLVTSSLGFFFIGLCYLLVDDLKIWNGSPFFQTGMNSIALYVGHFFTFGIFPWHYKFGSMNTHMTLLLECLIGVTLWVIIALYLHRKRKFYTV